MHAAFGMGDALQGLERQGRDRPTARVRGDDSMKVQCESCNAYGQVSDEASLRAVLWICDACGVRYLVSSRGMRRAPLPPPPPPPRRSRNIADSELPHRLSSESAQRASAPSSEPATAPSPPASKATEPRLHTERSLPAIPIAKTVTGVRPEPLPLFNASAPSFPIMTVPVHDPLWRRPALLASALAGLLVGLAAYGVRWTRDQVQNYEPAVATAAAAPQETQSPALPLAEEPEGVIANEKPDPTPPLETTIEAASEETRAEPPSRMTPKGSHRARAPRVNARAPTARAPKKEEPLTVAAVSQPASEALPSPPPKSPATLADAMADSVESREGSEPQAKSQPASSGNAARLDGYTSFSRDAALSALSAAASSASRCRSNEGPFGAARIAVTFAPSGHATAAIIEGPPFAGTPVGSCIARAFREARVSPFSGAPVTVRKSVSIF